MSIFDSPLCRCGHALAVHDPCSMCRCPGFDDSKKPRKYTPRKKD